MPDDIKQKREALKGKLLDAFNKAAPNPKIMRADELAKNVDKEDDKYYGFFEKLHKWIAEKEMNKLLNKPAPSEQGVFVGNENGKEVTYLSSEYLKRKLIESIDAGRVDKYMDDAEKMGKAAADAVKITTDQTDKVKSGAIKLKVKPGA